MTNSGLMENDEIRRVEPLSYDQIEAGTIEGPRHDVPLSGSKPINQSIQNQ